MLTRSASLLAFLLAAANATAQVPPLVEDTSGGVSPGGTGSGAADDAEEEPEDPGAEVPTPFEPGPLVPDADAGTVRYRIRASVDGPRVSGEVDIEIDPVGAAEMRNVVLFQFPNLLGERLAGEDSRSYFTLHPKRFRRGGMRLTALSTAEGEALPWTGVDVTRSDGKGGRITLPWGTAIRATLPAATTDTVRLRARFEVEVPERFGTFSWYAGDLFLSGGWYPMVAARSPSGDWDLDGEMPRADASVTVEVPADHWALVAEELHPPAPGASGRRLAVAEVRGRPHVLLAVSDALYVRQGHGVRVLQTEKRAGHARRIRENAESALRFLEDERVAVTGTGGGVLLFEAPLTRELAFHDAPVGLVSFRIYRVLDFLKRYHDVHVGRAAISAQLRDRVYELEPGEDASWVLDAVVWYHAMEWQERVHPGMRDIRDYARPLSFLPAVDLVLNTPDFPFAAEYYDNWYFTDIVRDDVTRFNHLRPNGRVAYEKLVDLVGAEKAREVMQAYVRGSPADGGFRMVAERVLGRDLDWFFEQWRGELPRVNYVMQKVLVHESANGEWISQFKLLRRGDDVVEPVRVRARAAGKDATETWDSSEDSTVIELYTRTKPEALEVDWRNRLLETNRRDNRWPPQWRMLLQYAWVDYEFKLNTADAAVGVQFERSNDLRDEIDLGAFVLQQSRGAQLGYIHSYGPHTFYRGLLHRFGLVMVLEDLEEGFGKDGLHVIPGFDPEKTDVSATLGANLIYRYDSRDDWRFSRYGTRLFAAAEVGTSIRGPASQYRQVEAELVHLRRVTDNNVLAVQAKAGTFVFTDPASVPLSKLFYLGGIDDVRGISAPDIVGPTKLVTTGEWRHFVLHDLDTNLWLGRIRNAQGAFFVDSGYIAPRTRSVPPLGEWVTAVGYGLRMHYDLFGVRPMVFRMDLAQRVDDFRSAKDRDVRLYIGAGQSF